MLRNRFGAESMNEDNQNIFIFLFRVQFETCVNIIKIRISVMQIFFPFFRISVSRFNVINVRNKDMFPYVRNTDFSPYFCIFSLFYDHYIFHISLLRNTKTQSFITSSPACG